MTSHFLNGPFIDALEEDLENVTRLNEVIEHLELEERERLNLAVVDVMSISPSKRIDDMAADHIASLPSSMRFLMKILGATRAGGGASLASYLMFESPFLRELIECGYDDAIARRDDIERFLS
ncbi:MAG: hypothetical protein U5O39_06920 [Gammaproteobacteria bacterium]|nr:hypothetical protein [Gammaproteobacteria bacterium]